MCTICQSLNPTIATTSHDLDRTPTVAALTPVTTTVASTSVVLPANFSEGADAASGTSTGYVIEDGDSFAGSLSDTDTSDWIRIDLNNGDLLNLEVDSTNNSYDISLNFYDANGNFIQSEEYYDRDQAWDVFYNDTGAASTYYVEVYGFNGQSQNYTLTANITEYGIGTYDEIAEGLTTSWFGTPLYYDVSVGDTIFFNHDKLNANGRFLAETALEAWSAVTGLVFEYSSFVTSSNGMEFDDSQSGAFAGPTGIGENGAFTGSTINVGTAWLNTYGTTVGSYSFSTYLHEIGHALGLDHSGPYNGSATYSTTPGGDNVWINDSTLATVMSYFDYDDVTGVGTDYWDPVTPMMSDIMAMQLLYGTAGNLRDGDTTYGENSNAGGYYDDIAGIPDNIAMTIIDDGGEDTLDYGSSTSDNNVDLRPGETSDLGGLTNNLMIFDTTFIENVILGSGDDFVEGNSLANLVYAGGGTDTVDGNNGGDKIYGQGGQDEINGGGGNDVIFGGGDNDVLDGGTGNDRLNGGGNADTALGGDDDDKVYGNGGQDSLFGDAGQDSVFGGGGNDTMAGGDDDDFLAGGRGRDTITAGDGDDVIIGGSDKDVFVFDNNDDTNIIEDFQNGVDRFLLTNSDFGDVNIAFDGTDTTLTFANTTVILEGIDESLINANDFI